ncbi:Fatty acid oxidation complex subunit alpha [Pelagimonas phthalicica]|uniref:Fatty acid oxidation complex subunit alpha n=1 Tax=Pelagimonas phthalicica TaxID=1037362 RepID=A0A238JAC8_9RHOB|nr:3-hydroxyacyl-CoA dehydrogenase NAD-binding domain-containing protein [Pelagimonas phthalicica]TDS93858.1 3-hydroxyacyl-CoA dehydrogenase [Pelagimonas phthalicica]SMX27618.1 Fatty acid oxidation complex subunit alpha [Pelagimonas phthalicica]
MTIHYERQGDIAVLKADNPPVNALGQTVRQGLVDGVARANEDGAKAIVIYGEGRTWFAGADIREFGKTPLEPYLPDVCNIVEASAVPVIAAMHGTALGGGLEVALGCHYRVAVPTAKMGLPEVHLGLIPGAGATQRLPRLIGHAAAIDMMTSGRPIGADKALTLGIIDKIETGDPLEIGLAYAQELIGQNAQVRPVSALPVPDAIDFDAARDAVRKKSRGQISPVVAVDAVEAATRMDFSEGLAEERRLFMELMKTDQRQGMIHAFFGERQVSKLPELQGVAPRDVAEIGVIGGGTMGAGIATAALLSGLHVVLIEMTAEAAEAAKGRIAGNLSGALKRGKIEQDKHDHILNDALTCATDYVALSNADLIIEAVFENMDVKKEVFGKLDTVAKAGAILASNTSYLNVDEIAASTSRPADVIGLHFFSPAHVMKLLEVVVGKETAPDVVATGFALGKRLGKISVRSGVCDGFIGNRILNTYRSCADHLILDGASPYQIDKVMEGFGFAMGPFAVSDLAGLDIGWANRKRLAPTRDARERVPTYADKLCEDGHFGQKTGRGYYVYDGRAKSPNPDVMPLIQAERAELGLTDKGYSDDQILRRYMAAMVNEAAKILGEGIARRPLDVDMVLLFGYGFPRYNGGPLKWADLQGLPALLEDIRSFAQEDAYFWQPAPLLEQLVAEGRNFEDLNKEAAA